MAARQVAAAAVAAATVVVAVANSEARAPVETTHVAEAMVPMRTTNHDHHAYHDDDHGHRLTTTPGLMIPEAAAAAMPRVTALAALQ